MQFMCAISPTQCKAARTYLEWQQGDLAKAANLSISTIRSFENGFSPRRGSVVQIREALENTGIEFTEGEGIKRRDTELKLYRGANSCDRFFDDLLQTVKEQGGDIACVMQSQDMMIRSCGVSDRDHLNRLKQLNDIASVKCLMPAATGLPPFVPPFEFRTIAQPHIGPSSYYIYGNKHAHVWPEGGAAFSFVVLNAALATQGHRSHFLTLWDHALPVRLCAGQQESGS